MSEQSQALSSAADHDRLFNAATGHGQDWGMTPTPSKTVFSVTNTQSKKPKILYQSHGVTIYYRKNMRIDYSWTAKWDQWASA